MRFQDEMAELRRVGEEKLLHARIIARVAQQTGMHRAMGLAAANVFLREVLKGKPEPSLAFRIAAMNVSTTSPRLSPNVSHVAAIASRSC